MQYLTLREASFPPNQFKSLEGKKKKKQTLSLISKLKQEMRINIASHSHLELLLEMEIELEKYSGSALFCACLKPVQRMLWCFLFVCFLFRFRKSVKASSVINLAKKVLL